MTKMSSKTGQQILYQHFVCCDELVERDDIILLTPCEQMWQGYNEIYFTLQVLHYSNAWASHWGNVIFAVYMGYIGFGPEIVHINTWSIVRFGVCKIDTSKVGCSFVTRLQRPTQLDICVRYLAASVFGVGNFRYNLHIAVSGFYLLEVNLTLAMFVNT